MLSVLLVFCETNHRIDTDWHRTVDMHLPEPIVTHTIHTDA